MTLVDFILIVVCGMVSFYIGRLYRNNDHSENVQVINVDGLSLEKINNIYYAYLGEKFVGQSSTIDELVHNMRDIYKVSLFNFDNIESLTSDENNQVRQSIEKWYPIV
jgi:hypothetical protein